MGLKMIKFQLLLTVLTLSQAAYYSRMTTLNRVRPPTAFRPGVALRPWTHRLVPAATHRAPYVVYRPPQRFAVKHYAPTTRNVFTAGPWKTTRLPGPAPVTPEYELVRAASTTLVQNDGGAIHTIPAPNLSLSERPIVVVDSDNQSGQNQNRNAAAEQVKKQGYYDEMRIKQPKPSYEVTEKYIEPVYQMAKIETPVGFTKTQSIQSSPDLQTYLRNGAALQIASDYGLSAIGVPHSPVVPQSHVSPQPQQFTVQGLQGFNGIPVQQEVLHSGADNVMIPPNVLYQSDPMFLQKLQQQLLHRFPALEFVPYAAELLPPNPQPNNPAPQAQQLFLLQNEEIRQPPEPFVTSESKNVVQRETQEGSVVTLVPQAFLVSNATEKSEPTTTQQPRNITLELIAAESQPVTTTIKYVTESSTEAQNNQNTTPIHDQNATPIYYAQIGQSVGNVVANGFYSAINDVRAAAALEQAEHTQTTKELENPTTTVSPALNPDLKQYFFQNSEVTENKTVTELKPLHGVPFAKPADSVKVAYTLLRTEEKEPKMTKEGTVYAGQIVEASISEDQEFNSQKATLMKRAPIRLFAVSDKKDVTSSTPKVTMVKAKIPPKSKLTFDDKTGEPVLRIYASYVDSPAQCKVSKGSIRQRAVSLSSVLRSITNPDEYLIDDAVKMPHRKIVTSKLASLKPAVTRKATIDSIDSWKSSTVKTVDKTQGFDGNQVTQFGLKLRSRSDDYIPLFEEYEE